MVKGISKQVIVVQAPEPKLFEQAIFILKEDALPPEGITDEQLLTEAKKAMGSGKPRPLIPLYRYGPVWACGGAALTGLVWLVTALL